MPTPARRRLLPVALAGIALLVSACGGDDQRRGADITTPPTVATTTTSKPDGKPADNGVTTTARRPATTAAATGRRQTVVARDIKFIPLKLTIPVNEEVEILFDNRDSGQAHNIHFFTPDEKQTDITIGKSSGVKDRLTLEVSEAGTYKFTCDVHPTPDMTGELTVK